MGKHSGVYTRAHKRQVMQYWKDVALPARMTRKRVSEQSKELFGFHVPVSTLGSWVRTYRRHKAKGGNGAPMTVETPRGGIYVNPEGEQLKVPFENTKVMEAVRDIRTEKQLLTTLIIEQRQANVTLNIIAQHLFNISESLKPQAMPEPFASEKQDKRRLWSWK